jgi:purine-binding chemotaxis protein CheW
VNEVAALDRAYPLPLLPEYVKGIINRYSAPYALIDIGLMIFKKASSSSKVVVLKESEEKLAFMIDDVVDIIDIPRSSLLKIEQDSGGQDTPDIIEASFEWHNTHVFVLSIHEIISMVKNDL